ncbi:hypothetical protein KEF85_04525 [Methylomonas paludis]|uniref:Uncharacterized protein n=1 Tax=Methylomonas paludis TaxID=1173101 RepID=A0A975RA42_9GAMM|nr:hypothetical protein [Methylomonas paludis]QWF71747.1 hypothetical protein KEF85_04525 [Methylomonas paludis]
MQKRRLGDLEKIDVLLTAAQAVSGRVQQSATVTLSLIFNAKKIAII